jgi:hypothetical protein
MFGALGGISIAVGRTPWSVAADCRAGTAPCPYNVRDQVRAISRSAVDIDPVKSRFVYLPQVRNWPSNYCGFNGVKTAILAALATYASSVDPDSFAHLLMIVPRHCALGQGNQPGERACCGLWTHHDMRHVPCASVHAAARMACALSPPSADHRLSVCVRAAAAARRPIRMHAF